MGRRGCNLQTGSSRRRAGRCIHTGLLRESYHGSSRRTLRSDYTRIHPVSPSMTTSSTRPAAISAPNMSSHATNGWTSHLLAPMLEKIVPVHGHMTAQRAGTGLERARLFYTHPRPRIDGTISLNSHPTLRHSARNPTQSLCLAAASEMGTQSFFDAGCADDSQVEFRVSAYHWQRILGNGGEASQRMWMMTTLREDA